LVVDGSYRGEASERECVIAETGESSPPVGFRQVDMCR
jgi:hypothetical protein